MYNYYYLMARYGQLRINIPLFGLAIPIYSVGSLVRGSHPPHVNISRECILYSNKYLLDVWRINNYESHDVILWAVDYTVLVPEIFRFIITMQNQEISFSIPLVKTLQRNAG